MFSMVCLAIMAQARQGSTVCISLFNTPVKVSSDLVASPDLAQHKFRILVVANGLCIMTRTIILALINSRGKVNFTPASPPDPAPARVPLLV